MRHYRFSVSKKSAGERLGNFVTRSMSLTFSHKEVKRLIDSKQCKVNGVVEKFASYKLKEDDKIEFVVYPKKEEVVAPVKGLTLYEDEHLMIINKPINCTCTSIQLEEFLQKKPLYLVHRLDRDTSGILILAKTKPAQKKMEEAFKERKLKKVYHAICKGKPEKKKFFVENYLAPLCQYEGGSIYRKASIGFGKYAKTAFVTKRIEGGYCFMECDLQTGVTHQIRSHLQESGLPILGDYQYERTLPFLSYAQRPLLHAYYIEFFHPILMKKIAATAPYPEDFKNAKTLLFSK